MDLGLHGKLALVTGGDFGIGWHTAQQLHVKGATAVISDLHQTSWTKTAPPRTEAPRPDEVASVIVFGCSERASFVNGSNYRVDAGSVVTI